MAHLQLKDVPEPVHEELRRRARARGISLRDYVLELIRRDQERPAREDWIASLSQLERLEPRQSSVELIDDARSERP